MRTVKLVTAVVVAGLVLGGLPARAQDADASVRPGATDTTAAACFDYNGPKRPGRSWPWLEPITLDMLGSGLPATLDRQACLPGFFLYGRNDKEDLAFQYLVPGIELGTDGCPRDILDVYRKLIDVHPGLGGMPPRRLTKSEAVSPRSDPDTRCYTDLPADQRATVSTPSWGSVDALLKWYAKLHVMCLSPIAGRVVTGVGSLPAEGCSADPSPTPSPSPGTETRRYRVFVTGQESNIPDQYWKIKGEARKGARFDYHLVGEFTLARSGSSQPWKVASERVTTADVRPSSLFPGDRYQLELSCPKCLRLKKDTRLYVTVEGDEVIVGWRPFSPEVRLSGTCAGCRHDQVFHLGSDHFWSRITGTRLPLEDANTSAPTRITNASGDVVIWYAYGLERRP